MPYIQRIYRVFWLRALVVVTLLLVAAVIGWTSYAVLQSGEQRNGDSVYESVSGRCHMSLS
jgi:predicted negative regulator of RcsB-dependent stress response